MAFGFSVAPEGIEDAICDAVSRSNVIFLAATSNEGLTQDIAYPARWHHLVLPVFATGIDGWRLHSNPGVPSEWQPFATLGDEVPSASLFGQPSDPHKCTRTGASVSTVIMASLVSCILEFVRLRETKNEHGRLKDWKLAKVYKLNGIKRVLSLMAEKKENNIYIDPEHLSRLGIDDCKRLERMREVLIDA